MTYLEKLQLYKKLDLNLNDRDGDFKDFKILNIEEKTNTIYFLLKRGAESFPYSIEFSEKWLLVNVYDLLKKL